MHTSKPAITLYTYAQKVNHLKVLYYMATHDGEINLKEFAFMKRVAKKLEIDISVLKNINKQPLEFVMPDCEYKVYALFHRVVLMMMINNRVLEKDINFCISLGVRMGLHPQATKETIRIIMHQGVRKTSAVEIINIFKKFSN